MVSNPSLISTGRGTDTVRVVPSVIVVRLFCIAGKPDVAAAQPVPTAAAAFSFKTGTRVAAAAWLPLQAAFALRFRASHFAASRQITRQRFYWAVVDRQKNEDRSKQKNLPTGHDWLS